MLDDTSTLEAGAAALLLVDCESGELIDLNTSAEVLLGQDASNLLGGHWRSCLGIEAGVTSPLDHIFEARVGAPLPPTLLCPAKGEEVVVAGMSCPRQTHDRAVIALYLYPLARLEDLGFAGSPASGDVVLVLGVNQIDSSPGQVLTGAARLMMDIRSSLQQIVPGHDTVGLPAGGTIAVILREIGTDEALDICAALLSHLRPLLSGRDEEAPDIRLNIGLAVMDEEQSALAIFTAANQALAQAQFSGEAGRLVVAGEDGGQFVSRAVTAHGIFTSLRPSVETQTLLAAMTALVVDSQRPGEYLEKVVGLLQNQTGVAAVALYHRRYDGSCDFIAGGLSGSGGAATARLDKSLLEQQLPRWLRDWQKTLDTPAITTAQRVERGGHTILVAPLDYQGRRLGFLLIGYDKSRPTGDAQRVFVPDSSAVHQLASQLATLPGWQEGNPSLAASPQLPVGPQLDVEGYVEDNMEGAIDQAMFLARVDMPVAVIGPRGTGKLYVAKIIHQEAGGEPDQLVYVDCREFRSRRDALSRISHELERSQDKTLVFKSPHLMNAEAQLKLARQLSTRILADSNPPRYLPRARYVGLFPDSLEHLVRHGGLDEKLASVFAGFPILVPPLRVRKRAILRWAHKILSQECARRDRKFRGFTPDAQLTLLHYEWPGNISEMRQCIKTALDKTDKDWITPVDLGIFRGTGASGATTGDDKRTFLEVQMAAPEEEQTYSPSPLEELAVALGESLHTLLEHQSLKPLGAWLDDELVLAACERYRGDMSGTARFLHTRPRNISRWMPKILGRDHERNSSLLWQGPRALVRQWVQESAMPESPPQQLLQDMLMTHVLSQCDKISVADRARIIGVSVPTYQKRLSIVTPR